MKNNIKHIFLSITLVIVTFFAASNTYSQETKQFNIVWKTPTLENNNGISEHHPSFEGKSLSGDHLNYVHFEEVPLKSNATFELLDFSTAAADEKEKKYLLKYQISVSETPTFTAKITNGFGKRMQALSIDAFIKKGDQFFRVTSFSIKKTATPFQQSYQSKAATQSVLRQGNGTWYKIAVTQDGVHKIDKAFLASMGIGVSNLNPQHIHIYGNGDGRLPDENDGDKTDDLAQNAIVITGDTDGTFDDNDYILFFAKGPHRWDLSSTGNTFVNTRHIYSDYSYYFIHINANVAPKRIQTINSSNLPVTDNVNSYSYRAVHEVDSYNATKSGQRWYGEKFDVELSRNFNFSMPNPVPNTPSQMYVSMCSDSKSAGAGSISYTVNGQLLENYQVPQESSGYHARKLTWMDFNNSNSNISLNILFNRLNPNVSAYLDKIEVNSRRQLVMLGNQFQFRDLQSVGAGKVGAFSIQSFPVNGFVWDVTNRHEPIQIAGTQSGSTFNFNMPTNDLKEYTVSNGNVFLNPTFVSIVSPQNLHALSQVDYLIITPTQFISQANRLADLHRTYNNLTVHVVDVNQIYNEFSGGAQDAGAIRTFAKMFYDRSTNSADALKYLCLFGDGSYDPKNRVSNNNNFIPTYQFIGSSSSESPTSNILADDFYGALDDNDAMSSLSILDIGVGRLIINSTQNAQEQVNKIEHYMKNGSGLFKDNNINCIDGISTSTFGEWRTKITSVADLEDHFTQIDHEPGSNYLNVNSPEININKLYMDAYNVQATAGGLRVPELIKDLENSFYAGSLITNYVGHGGSSQLSEARILSLSTIQELKNSDFLPLFVSATCDFTPFDDPEFLSAGEWMTVNPIGGAIAMMTTTRTVSYTDNSRIVSSFYKNALRRTSTNLPRTFGEIIMHTKASINAGAGSASAAFNLIGDPALRIALPRHKIVIDSINGNSPSLVQDTIQALSRVKVKAHIEDFNGNVLSNFNGIATPLLYDKPKQLLTLGQSPGGAYPATVVPYTLQKNMIYKGQSTITNGYFSFEFIVPKDIDYNYGPGKFSLYGNSSTTDAIGQDKRLIIGGVNPQGLADDVGPEISIFLNTESFVNGGLTDENPFLIAKLKDQNGINTVGNGIGHDITAIIDEKTNAPIVLNEYFKNDLDTYQSGQLRYQLTKLAPGRHTLTLKVWDVNNNSSQETVEFIVQEKSELKLSHVLNYPNPFTTSTDFYFEHNQCCTDLETQIQIFTVSGRLVKTLNQSIYTQGYRSEGIHWDGKDDYGDDLARGVYVYRLKVRTPNGEIAEKLEKLVLL